MTIMLVIALAVMFVFGGLIWAWDHRNARRDGYEEGRARYAARLSRAEAEIRRLNRKRQPWVVEVPPGPIRPAPRHAISVPRRDTHPFGPVAAHTASGEWLRAADHTEQLAAVTAVDLAPVVIPPSSELAAMSYEQFRQWLGLG